MRGGNGRSEDEAVPALLALLSALTASGRLPSLLELQRTVRMLSNAHPGYRRLAHYNDAELLLQLRRLEQEGEVETVPGLQGGFRASEPGRVRAERYTRAHNDVRAALADIA
jgi:hypothetical protein